VAAVADTVPTGRQGYPRATGSERGLARRRELLERIADDVAAHGLTDFSLRRAARAAGTTHKVLLYHFDSAESLLAEVVRQLRERRIDRGVLAAERQDHGGGTLAERVQALWPALVAAEGRVLDQAIGLSMVDPVRYADLARGASQQYLPALIGLCPPDWSDRRKQEVAAMVLATLRGFLIDRLVSDSTDGVQAGLAALARALDREEAAGDGSMDSN
jgi:AcrR family transcriptional regulator